MIREEGRKKRRDRVTLTIFVIPYTCAFERNEFKTCETGKEKGQRRTAKENERLCERKKKRIFIIVRVIRYRGIPGNDNEGDAERPREIIRLAITIIDHSESRR